MTAALSAKVTARHAGAIHIDLTGGIELRPRPFERTAEGRRSSTYRMSIRPTGAVRRALR